MFARALNMREARFCLALAAGAVLCWAAFAPERPLPSLFPGQDKYEHVIAFAAVSGLILDRSSTGSLAPALLIFSGFMVEAIQGVLGYRESSFADALASSLGVIVGWIASVSLRALVEAWIRAERRLGRVVAAG